MKKIILFLYLVLVSFGMFTSCEAPVGELYNQEGTKISFQTTEMTANLVDDDGTILKVGLNRSNTNGAFDVALESVLSNNAKDLFTVPAVAHFDAGQGTSYIEISHPVANQLDPAAVYDIKVKYTDKELHSPSAIDSVLISVKRQLTWKVVGSGTFSSEFFGEAWSQDLEQAVESPTLYRLPSCYYSGVDLLFTVNADNSISYSTQFMGYVDSSYGRTSWMMPRPQAQDYGAPEKEGNEYFFVPEFIVSAGSFGQALEQLTLE